MTTAEPTTLGARVDHPSNNLARTEPRERTPWLLAILSLLTGFLPSYCVLPGPLKSNGSPAILIAFTLFCLSLMGMGLFRRNAVTRTVRPGVLLILLYLLLSLIIYGAGGHHFDGVLVEANKTRSMIWLTATVGVGLYTTTRVETARQRAIVLGCLSVGLTFACFVAVLQNSTGIDLHLLFQPPGFVVNTTDQGRGVGGEVITRRFGSVRAQGTAIHPIELSVMAATAVPLTIHFARFATNRSVRWFSWLGCGAALLAIPATGSRSGIVSLGAALLVSMWAFKLRHLATGVIAAAAFLLFQMMAFPKNIHALQQSIVNAGSDLSIIDRTNDYARVSETFRQHPVFGLGLGGALPSQYGFLDNQWLQAVVQGGIIGFTSMVVLAAGGLFGISAALRRATDPRERDQVYAMGASFVAILVSSYTFDLFSFPQVTLTFFILFGLLWSKFTVSLPETKIVRPAADHGAG
jgi:polysaccharide biosynthesis protein PslJ